MCLEAGLGFEAMIGCTQPRRVAARAGFLPSQHQGVQFRGGRDPVLYLSDPDGRHVMQSAEGEGPVAALFAALAQATGVDFVLESYEVHSMGIGRDARGEANLGGRIGGETLSGQGTSRDVLEASAIAWLDVANRVLRTQATQPVAIPA